MAVWLTLSMILLGDFCAPFAVASGPDRKSAVENAPDRTTVVVRPSRLQGPLFRKQAEEPFDGDIVLAWCDVCRESPILADGRIRVPLSRDAVISRTEARNTVHLRI